ncbi:MAG: NAD-dependent epimerase/dehydratase family protein [Flammeovirgaceae bacterium]
MKLLITGQEGFIGYHLYNTLKFKRSSFELLNFKKKFFQNKKEIDKIISQADAIIHLAGLNRSEKEQDILDKNLFITNKIINSISRTGFNGKLIFASSIQQEDDNAYGVSKKISSENFFNASSKYGFTFINLVIPNVFGPFGRPNYNSFIATFCYNSVNKIENFVEKNKNVPLIYIDNLVHQIIEKLKINSSSEFKVIEDIKIKVNKVKNMIDNFNEVYIKNGNIPDLNNQFKVNLFNTFHSYVELATFFPNKHKLIKDERGSFSEILKASSKGQISFSTTNPGYTRGNHFHTRKIERFSVLKGEAVIKIRKIGSNKVYTYNLSGKTPSYIDMKVWHTHSIQNIGNTRLITLFWINEFYDENDSDTFFEKV